MNATAAELRAAFDGAFAAPIEAAAAEGDGFLDIVVGGDRFLMRLGAVAGLFVDCRVVAVPAKDAALLGITGLRGAIVPVYRLDVLLGYEAGDAPPRWLATVAGHSMAFAFDRLERHLQMPHEATVPRVDGKAAYIREAALTDQGTLPLIDLAALAASVAHP